MPANPSLPLGNPAFDPFNPAQLRGATQPGSMDPAYMGQGMTPNYAGRGAPQFGSLDLTAFSPWGAAGAAYTGPDASVYAARGATPPPMMASPAMTPDAAPSGAQAQLIAAGGSPLSQPPPSAQSQPPAQFQPQPQAFGQQPMQPSYQRRRRDFGQSFQPSARLGGVR